MLYPLAVQIRAERAGVSARSFVLFLSCAILFFFFAFRGIRVGVDTKNYCYVFQYFEHVSLKNVFTAPIYGSNAHTWTFEFEPGYRLINKLLSYMTNDGQAITIALGIIIFILLALFVYRESPNIWLSMWLFVTLGFFQTSMNATRITIVLLICFLAFPLIENRKPVLYVLIVLLASTIHQSALLFLPVYPLIRFVPLNRRRVFLIFLLALFVGLNCSLFSETLQKIVPSRYARYFSAGNDKWISAAVGVFNLLVVITAVLLLARSERKNVFEGDKVGSWIFFLHICFFALDIGFKAGARTAALFGPYVVVLVPQILNRIENASRKRAAVFLIAALCFAQYIARMQINNIGGTIPYSFFWQT